MMKKVLFVTSNIGVEHAALTEPLEGLKDHGFEVIHAVENKAEIETVEENIKPAFRYPSEYYFQDIDVEDFSALVLPGGVANADLLRIHPQVIHWIQHFTDEAKVIGVTGHSAWLLINAERIQNKTITTCPQIRLDVVHAGAHWSDELVYQCQENGWTLISTHATDDFETFTEMLIQVLEA